MDAAAATAQDGPKYLVREEIRRAKSYREADPAAFLMGARRACEAICRDVCAQNNLVDEGSTAEGSGLERLKNLLRQNKLIPEVIYSDIVVIQIWGNLAAHSLCPIRKRNTRSALGALHNIQDWYFEEDRFEDTARNEGRKPKLKILGTHNIRMRTAAIAGSTRAVVCKLAEKRRQATTLLRELKSKAESKGSLAAGVARKNGAVNRWVEEVRSKGEGNPA
jgi:hypothetical protein